MAVPPRTTIARTALLVALLTAGLTYWLWSAEQRARSEVQLAPEDSAAEVLPTPATLAEADAETRARVAAAAAERTAPPAPAPEPVPPVAAAPEVLASEPTGRIFGRVLGPDGQPAALRAVRLLRTNGSGIETATTDADGVYDQRGLVATRYHVSTQPSETELEALAARGFATKLGGLVWLAQASVPLAAGQEVEVDLGFPPEHPIRARGRLIGADAETSAVLQWVPQDEHGYDLARYTPTRADGTYDVLLARPGPYHLAAIVSPGSCRVDGTVHVPDASDFEHDVVLPRGRIVVTVLAESGAPVPAATVDFGPRAGIAPIPWMSTSSFSKPTSPEGRVELGFMRAGTWNVAVHDARLGDVMLAAQCATVHVEDSDAPTELELVLRPGIVLKGTVVAEDGAPLAGANALVFDAAGEPLSPLKGSRSSKTGEFKLTGLLPGDYALVAARGDRWSAVVPFSLREGEPAPELTLAVAPAARLVVDRSGLAEAAWIDVRDEQGRLFSALLDWNLFSGHYGRGSSTVDARYFLPAGNYSVRAMGAGGVIASATAALVAGESRRLTLR